MDFNLTLRTAVHRLASKTDSPTPIPAGNITNLVTDWTRNRVWMGGDDAGKFTIAGPTWKLVRMFRTWLALDLVETIAGGVESWNGRVVKLVLKAGGAPLTRDITDMYNRVRATVGDGIGTYTSFYQNLYSQQAYGKREKWLQPGVESESDAAAQAQAFLSSHAWPFDIPAGSNTARFSRDATLDVYAIGYFKSLNDKIAPDEDITPADGVTDALDIVMDDSYYLTARSMDNNTTPLYNDVELIEAGEFTKLLLAVSDSSQNLYRGWVNTRREFYYRQVSATPIYYISGGKFYASSGSSAAIHPRLLQPGVYRNLDVPVTGPNRNSWLEQSNDVWVNSIYLGPDGIPQWQPETTDLADFQTLIWSGEMPETAPVS